MNVTFSDDQVLAEAVRIMLEQRADDVMQFGHRYNDAVQVMEYVRDLLRKKGGK
jgi:hypothetical protein